ncbi:Integrase catalytic domain-containing protein [Mesorhizobium ventifaucium]|uniref:Integrase catalytic domain-containing protein n=1 Tax=Mesorhizobium ventifaucium TaxID=666020 RepID=A0ABM9DRX6_9HYPH|nr:Integrase catalytic domain-containing protein [Mesorhizobium ventifaucium]
MDASCRYLLALEATGSTADEETWPVFERLFGKHGLPDRFRSDNGPPFASAGVTGLTPLAVSASHWSGSRPASHSRTDATSAST